MRVIRPLKLDVSFFCKHSIFLSVAIGVAVVALCGAVGQAVAKDKGATISNSARLGGDSQRTRFVADLSKKVKFRLFTLADPYRVIIDLPDVNFQMPANLGTKGRGLVTAFRFGKMGPGKSRIVIDVARPFLVDKLFIISARNSDPARLVLDLVPSSKDAFLAAQKEMRRKTAAANANSRKGGADPGELTRIARGGVNKSGKPVVVIDPGHGGIDSGAVGVSGAKEKNVVLEFGIVLRERLLRTGKFEVHMTRSDDTFIPLPDRVKIAQKKGAGLLISIHADSLPKRRSRGVRGATVYTLSEKASDSEARALAAKENRSDILAGLELPENEGPLLSNILYDLVRRETKNQSIGFANMLLGGIKGRSKLNKKPHRFANLRVLRAPDVPSVLLELGYMTSKEDEKLLRTKKWQVKVADGIVGSVRKFFANAQLGVSK